MEKEIIVSAKHTLKGTISLPNDVTMKRPGILLIAGSGKGDRNGNMKGMNSNIYQQLSHFFVSLGFVTLRYDKRGIGESEGDFYSTGMWDLVEDAKVAVATLKAQPEVDPNNIIVVGHSEGAMLGSALASKASFKGLIMLAGAGQSLPEATDYQRELAYEEIRKMTGIRGALIKKLNIIEKDRQKAKRIFDKMVNTEKDTVRHQFIKMNAKWYREHSSFDHVESFKNIPCPVLAITGSKDVQANPNSLEKLHDLKRDVETHVIKDMNHMLKIQEEPMDITKIKKIYQQGFDNPFPDELKDIMRTWMTELVTEKGKAN